MIKIVNLCKTYGNNVKVLKNVSISINNGDFFALLGKNGAGKSTTLGVLTSLVLKNSGKVYINHYDLDHDLYQIKKLIGFVPQEYNFNQFESVLDIVINQAGFYGIEKNIAYIKAVFYLKLFNLWEKRNLISMNLSGGMKRRLMIVRSLIHDPEILILDEPTAGVDVLSRRLIWKFLQTFNLKGKTIILTTHYFEEVEKLCNHVAIMDNGLILLKTNVVKLLTCFNRHNFFIEIKNINFLHNLNNYPYKFKIKRSGVLEYSLDLNVNLNLFFKFFIDNDIMIKNIFNKKNNLEDLFIDLIS